MREEIENNCKENLINIYSISIRGLKTGIQKARIDSKLKSFMQKKAKYLVEQIFQKTSCKNNVSMNTNDNKTVSFIHTDTTVRIYVRKESKHTEKEQEEDLRA